MYLQVSKKSGNYCWTGIKLVLLIYSIKIKKKIKKKTRSKSIQCNYLHALCTILSTNRITSFILKNIRYLIQNKTVT